MIIIATLEMFCFGEYFVDWIKMILGCNDGTNFKAVTVVNGYISTPFDIKKGMQTRGSHFRILVNFGNGNFSPPTNKK